MSTKLRRPEAQHWEKLSEEQVKKRSEKSEKEVPMKTEEDKSLN